MKIERQKGGLAVRLGANIRNEIERQGLVKVALAGRLGISVNALGKIERADVWPRPATLEAIRRELGVPLSALLGEAGGETLARLRDTISALRGQINAARRDNEGLVTENEALRAAILELRTANTRLQTQFDEFAAVAEGFAAAVRWVVEQRPEWEPEMERRFYEKYREFKTPRPRNDEGPGDDDSRAAASCEGDDAK